MNCFQRECRRLERQTIPNVTVELKKTVLHQLFLPNVTRIGAHLYITTKTVHTPLGRPRVFSLSPTITFSMAHLPSNSHRLGMQFLHCWQKQSVNASITLLKKTNPKDTKNNQMAKGNHIGIDYVLSNRVMPGLVEIGMTTRPGLDAQLKELYTTGV